MDHLTTTDSNPDSNSLATTNDQPFDPSAKEDTLPTFSKEQRALIRASFLKWRKQVFLDIGLDETDACAHLGKLQFSYGAPCNPGYGAKSWLTKASGIDKAVLTRLFTDGGRGTLLKGAMALDNHLGGGVGLWAAVKTMSAKEKAQRLQTRKDLLEAWFIKKGPMAGVKANPDHE